MKSIAVVSLVGLVTVVCVPLAACSAGGGTEVRKSLASCMLNPKAKDAVGGYDDGYLMLCMQAEGYVTDAKLRTSDGKSCGELFGTEELADCYRPDTAIAKWLTDRQSAPAKPN